jgi:hypothetical protein
MTRRESTTAPSKNPSGLLKSGEGAALPKVKPAKPAKPEEGVGETVGVRVRVGEDRGEVVGFGAVVDVLMLILLLRVRGEGEAGSALRVEDSESEKTVRSFWRERAGERRVEGILCAWVLVWVLGWRGLVDVLVSCKNGCVDSKVGDW